MLLVLTMKTTHSPRQVLARDRARKTHYRNARYQEGWRQHTLWTTDEGWREILLAVIAAGPGKVRGGLGCGGGVVAAKGEGKEVEGGQGVTPAHTSDTEVGS